MQPYKIDEFLWRLYRYGLVSFRRSIKAEVGVTFVEWGWMAVGGVAIDLEVWVGVAP